ncbi:MAG: hypothetical protein NC489_13735 [Ruminococcus flavefaciens]|nr:hypothetical protein [Ruminococcus flavefaciens]
MLGFLRKRKCRKCAYYLGYIRFNSSPCADCKVNGGKNMPKTYFRKNKEC